MTARKNSAFSTRCIHGGQMNDPTTGAVNVPIYQTSTYAQSAPGEHKGFVYARGHNPTRHAFERAIADLEDGSAGYAFGSGLAAMCAVLDLLPAGAHMVASDDLVSLLIEPCRVGREPLKYAFRPDMFPR